MTELQKQGGIEITPQMIEAGSYALMGYNPDFETGGEIAVRIFSAMMEEYEKENRPATASGRLLRGR